MPKEEEPKRKRDLKALKKTQQSESRLGAWTEEEHNRMIEGFRLYGKDFDKVICHVGTRVESSVKNRAYQLKYRIRKDPTTFGADILPILEEK